MTFEEAKQRLLDLADGRACVINYGLMINVYDDQRPECKLYIDDLDFYSGENWEAAFSRIETAISEAKRKTVDESEQPN